MFSLEPQTSLLTPGDLSAGHFHYVETLLILSDGFIDDVKHSHFILPFALRVDCWGLGDAKVSAQPLASSTGAGVLNRISFGSLFHKMNNNILEQVEMNVCILNPCYTWEWRAGTLPQNALEQLQLLSAGRDGFWGWLSRLCSQGLNLGTHQKWLFALLHRFDLS